MKDEEFKQLLDTIIELIESDMMRGIVAARVVRAVSDYVQTATEIIE